MTSDEVEKAATETEQSRWREYAALIRRLRAERYEARNKALDEAIAALRDFADMTDIMGGKGSQELRIAASSIVALKSQEPSP